MSTSSLSNPQSIWVEATAEQSHLHAMMSPRCGQVCNGMCFRFLSKRLYLAHWGLCVLPRRTASGATDRSRLWRPPGRLSDSSPTPPIRQDCRTTNRNAQQLSILHEKSSISSLHQVRAGGHQPSQVNQPQKHTFLSKKCTRSDKC